MIQTTDDVEAITHAAMEKTDGNMQAAAALLQITPQKLRDRIYHNKNLKTRWRPGKLVSKPPGVPATIHRDPVIDESEESPLKNEQEIAAALEKQDAAIKKGMSAMGLKGDTLDLSIACQQFHRRHFRSAIEGMSGGIYRQFMRVMEEIDRIDNRLNDKGEFALTQPEELMLREDRSRLLVILGQFKDKVDKSVLIQAQVAKMMKEKEDKSNYKPKGVLDLESA